MLTSTAERKKKAPTWIFPITAFVGIMSLNTIINLSGHLWECACLYVSFQAGIDTGNMVKSTCTTFLKTLEECMQIANRTFSADMVTQSPPGSPPVAAIKPQKVCFLFLTKPVLPAAQFNQSWIEFQNKRHCNPLKSVPSQQVKPVNHLNQNLGEK